MGIERIHAHEQALVAELLERLAASEVPGVSVQGPLSAGDYGRDHHPRCFTIWMAGGGIKPGITYGATDDFCYNITANPVHVHDLHATILHLLGLDHEKLTYRYAGRDFRLTDVYGKVVRGILA